MIKTYEPLTKLTNGIFEIFDLDSDDFKKGLNHLQSKRLELEGVIFTLEDPVKIYNDFKKNVFDEIVLISEDNKIKISGTENNLTVAIFEGTEHPNFYDIERGIKTKLYETKTKTL